SSSPRKPNPPAMPRWRRLTTGLLTRKATNPARTSTNTICRKIPRTRGSRHGAGRLGRSALFAVSLAMVAGRARSADRHRVDQAALGPQIVEPAFELERRSEAEMLVEDLAVIADQLDLVVGPLLVEPQIFAHARGDAEHALDVGVVGFGHVIDILLSDPLL